MENLASKGLLYMQKTTKLKPKPKKASSSSKKTKEGEKQKHVCGTINGVFGKGAFSREGNKLICVECGQAHTKYPEGYLDAKKKLNPKVAALLEKGVKHKTTGEEHDKWVEAGKKAWKTRREHEKHKKE